MPLTHPAEIPIFSARLFFKTPARMPMRKPTAMTKAPRKNRDNSPPPPNATYAIPVPLLDIRKQNTPLAEEIQAEIARVCDSGAFVHGPDCSELETEIAAYCGTQYAVGCASGSDALLLSLMALDVGSGDEVILPSFTFFATAGAVWRLGATPVFVDIEPHSFNLDPDHLNQAITPATKVILPVHLFGRSAEMNAINEIAARHSMAVVEDAAQAIGAEYDGRRAGALGALGCFSFYPTKNLGGFGDGGMITTNDRHLAERLRKLRDHGQSPRYHHDLVGVNSRLDTLQAAVLRVKLRHLESWTRQRIAHASRYATLLAGAGLDQAIQPPHTAIGRHVWNQYTIRVADGRRDALRNYLGERQIGSNVYYPVPLHRQPCFASLGYAEGSLPETEHAAREVLSIPIFAELTPPQLETVVATIRQFFTEQKATKAA